MYFLLAFVTSFSVGFLVTPIVISVLRKAKIGDLPGGRKIHKKFTPSMGGIGFVIATFVALGIWGWQFPLPDIRYMLGAIALMFFVGLRAIFCLYPAPLNSRHIREKNLSNQPRVPRIILTSISGLHIPINGIRLIQFPLL